MRGNAKKQLLTLMPKFTCKQLLELMKAFRQFRAQCKEVKKKFAHHAKSQGGGANTFEYVLDSLVYLILAIFFWLIVAILFLPSGPITYSFAVAIEAALLAIPGLGLVLAGEKAMEYTILAFAVYFTTRFIISVRKVRRDRKE